MAACVLCEEINELFLEVVELLFGRAPNGGDTSRVAMSPIVYTACAYGLRLRLFAEWWRHRTDSGAKRARARSE